MQYRSILFLWLLFQLPLFSATPDTSLSFKRAVVRVLQHHPRLSPAKWRVLSAEAAVEQSDLLENPEIEVEVAGINASDIELRLAQKFPIGKKMQAERAIAEHVLEREKYSNEIVKREIELGLIEQFIPVAVAQEQCRMMDSLVLLTKELLEQIRRRVENGAARPVDTLRMSIELGRLTIEADGLRTNLKLAKEAFALFGVDSTLLTARGVINKKIVLPSIDTLIANIDNRPDRKDAITALDRYTLKRRALATKRYPDIVAAAGFIHNREEKTNDPLLALSLDLPLKNRNRLEGEIIDCDKKVAEMELQQERIATVGKLEQLYYRFAELDKRLQLIESVLVPQSIELVATLERYYLQGSGGLLEIIEARKEVVQYSLELLALYEEQSRCALEVMAHSGISIAIITEEK